VWIDIPALVPSAKEPAPVIQPTPVSIFRGNIFRDFAFSSDGRLLGVIAPGRRNLAIYQVATR
jgi:hypothetical protein